MSNTAQDLKATPPLPVTKSDLDEVERIKPFVKFGEYDEKQIVNEMRGQIIDEYFYKFEQDGREIVGISFAGIKHIANEMMKKGFPIKTTATIEDCGETYRGHATAVNITTGMEYPGFSEQPKKFKNGTPNPFAYTLAGSKAVRNALRNHIDEIVISEAYKQWKLNKTAKTKTIRNVTPPAQDPAQEPGDQPPKPKAPATTEGKTEEFPQSYLSAFKWVAQPDGSEIASVKDVDGEISTDAQELVDSIRGAGGKLTVNGWGYFYRATQMQVVRKPPKEN